MRTTGAPLLPPVRPPHLGHSDPHDEHRQHGEHPDSDDPHRFPFIDVDDEPTG
jgi:hypothetical protein